MLKFLLVVCILNFLSFTGYGQVVSTVAGVSRDADGPGNRAGFYSPNGVALDVQGNVYVADWGNNKIRKITPQGIVSTFAGDGARGYLDGEASKARFSGPNGIAIDAAGNLYISDYYGNRIRKITPAGVVSTLAGNGSAGNVDGNGTEARFNSPTALTVDGAGNVYVADTRNNKIRKISQEGVVSTLAGKGISGFADGAGTEAMFSNPRGIALDASGNLYVTDLYNHRIRKITPDGMVSTFAGSTAGRTDGNLSVAKFDQPYGIALDADGNIYVSDSYHLIRKISKEGLVGTLAGSDARFYNPHGIAVDAAGTIYVADFGNEKIRKVTQQGIVSTLAGIGVPMSVDGTGASVQFLLPSAVEVDKHGTIYIADGNKVRKLTKEGIATTIAGVANVTDLALDADGNIFVAEYTSNVIRKITPAGVVSTFAGSGAAGFVDGNGSNALFNRPVALTFDAKGNLYVSDQWNNCIRKITPNGDVSTFAGTAISGYQDGKAADARFHEPIGLDFDKNGNLYVADKYNHRIRKINPDGEVTTFAGSGFQPGGEWDGIGTRASFYEPTGLCVDSLGNVYMTLKGTGNNKIKKITPSAVVTTLAGNGPIGSTNGPAATARFNAPTGIAIDTNYNLYIADQYNFQIRKISLPNAIKVLHADDELVSGSATVDFGIVLPGNSGAAFSFRIESGAAAMKPLFLLGNPIVTVSGSDFIVDQSNTSSSVEIGGSTEFTITFKPTTEGVKTATVTIPNNNLGGSDYTFEIKGMTSAEVVTDPEVVTGIESSTSTLALCYPNPASSTVILNSPEAMLLEVYTAEGIKVMEQMVEKGANTVNIGSLPTGLYVFNMSSIGQRIKVMKE